MVVVVVVGGRRINDCDSWSASPGVEAEMFALTKQRLNWQYMSDGLACKGILDVHLGDGPFHLLSYSVHFAIH